MVEAWRGGTWGDLVSFEYGEPVKRYVPDGAYPVFGTNGPFARTDEYLAAGPSVIIGRKGAYRGVHYAPGPFWAVDTGFYLRPRVDLDMRWAYYTLLTHDINSLDTGSAIPSTSRDSLVRLPVLIPSVEEQQAIGSILGALDAKIGLNRRMNATLDAIARATFRSWFVDRDPLRAKANGPDSGLLPLAKQRLSGIQVSELDEVPTGWRSGSLSDFALLNPESWSKDGRPETLMYVDLANTKWGRIETVTTHTAATAPSRAQRVLRPGDTIVGTVRPGNGSYALVGEEGLTGSTGFAVLRPIKPEYAEFVYLAATDRENVQALAHLADGAAYPAVRPEVVLATPVIRPPDAVVAQFAELSRPLLQAMTANNKEAHTIGALRDGLMPKLISGELRVPKAERILEAVRS